LAKAAELADKVQSSGIRVGLDDRGETVGKKVREAKQDWVSFVIVVGDKELSSETLSVYDREANKNMEMPLEGLIAKIKEETSGKPFRPMYMPRELTRRVDF
jgi:threonyl-tRNA synthetase